MTSKQAYYALVAGVALLALGVLGAGYASNVILTGKAHELSKLKAEAQVSDDLQTALIKNKSDIRRYSELNQIAKTIVPQDKDQALTTREIVRLASESGIRRLTSVTFPASNLGGQTLKAAGPISQVTPVKGISGVYLLPITVSVNNDDAVTYPQFTTFLRNLEQNRRTSQISDISIKPDPKNPSYIAFSLVINEYIKP